MSGSDSKQPKPRKQGVEFFDLYKHPKWQKRRLEVMQKAEFSCQRCGSTEDILNVHHISYIKGRKPWEYDDFDLMCLCHNCHECQHDQEDRLKDALHEYKVTHLQCGESIEYLIGWLVAGAQFGPCRVAAQNDARWMIGFLEGSGVDSDLIDMDRFEKLIEADRGCIDHNWFWLFTQDSIKYKFQADHIRNNGFYCPDGFPDWYREKVWLMVKTCEEV